MNLARGYYLTENLVEAYESAKLTKDIAEEEEYGGLILSAYNLLAYIYLGLAQRFNKSSEKYIKAAEEHTHYVRHNLRNQDPYVMLYNSDTIKDLTYSATMIAGKIAQFKHRYPTAQEYYRDAFQGEEVGSERHFMAIHHYACCSVSLSQPHVALALCEKAFTTLTYVTEAFQADMRKRFTTLKSSIEKEYPTVYAEYKARRLNHERSI